MMTTRRAWFVAVLLCLAAAGTARAADIRVSTDRDTVSLDESFKILFHSDGSPDDEPDFAPLQKNFQILSTGKSSNFSLVNGDFKTSKTWTVTVLARHSGNLTIPPVTFGADKSPRSSVRVTQAKTQQDQEGEGDIYLEVSATPLDPYVQSQVLYDLKLYRALPTSNASLGEPQVESGDAVIERIGEDKSYVTRVNGKRYRVVERQYTVYPQASGTLTITPVEFRGNVSRSTFSLMDPFGPRPDTVVRRSAPVTLDVQPIPDSFSGKHWFPAAQVSLEQEWSRDPSKFRVGEPITRTLTLKAEGQTASQLPELPARVPDGFKDYPDQPQLENDTSGNGVVGMRREKTALIPQRPGEYTLPAIRIPWFNTATGKTENAELPAQTIKVAAAPGGAGQGSPAQAAPAPLGDLEKPRPPAPGDQAAPGPDSTAPEAADGAESGTNIWLLVSAAVVLIWLVTVLAWWISHRRRRQSGTGGGGDSRRRALRELKQACRQGDPRRARESLLQWGRLAWPDDPPLNPLELGRRLDPELEAAVRELNDSLYSHRPGQWDGEAFWRLFEAKALKSRNGKQNEPGKLEPLHRL